MQDQHDALDNELIRAVELLGDNSFKVQGSKFKVCKKPKADGADRAV
jgi:hypothetical protein